VISTAFQDLRKRANSREDEKKRQARRKVSIFGIVLSQTTVLTLQYCTNPVQLQWIIRSEFDSLIAEITKIHI